MDAAQFLPTEPSPEVTQIHEGDYKDADGLIVLILRNYWLITSLRMELEKQ